MNCNQLKAAIQSAQNQINNPTIKALQAKLGATLGNPNVWIDANGVMWSDAQAKAEHQQAQMQVNNAMSAATSFLSSVNPSTIDCGCTTPTPTSTSTNNISK